MVERDRDKQKESQGERGKGGKPRVQSRHPPPKG